MRNWSYIGSWRPGKKQCTAQNKDRIRQNSQQSPSICLSLRAEKFSKHQIEQGRSEEESGFSVWVTYFETRAWTCGEGVLVLRWCLRRVPYSECVDIYKFIHATSAEIKYSYHSIWTATCFEGMQRSRCTSMCDTGHVRQCTTTLCKHTTSQCIVLNFEASPWWRNISVLRANSGFAPHGKTAEAVTSETNAANRITWLDFLRQAHEATRLQIDGYRWLQYLSFLFVVEACPSELT